MTPEDGLANLYTSYIHQDQEGFIWISTRYGLNRYDGYSFDLFTEEENGLYSNKGINRILEDDSNNLWLFYTREGHKVNKNEAILAIDVFNTLTKKAQPLEDFINQKLPFKMQDLIMVRSSKIENGVYLTTKQGELYQYKNKEFKQIFKTSEGTPINYFLINKSNQLWSATGKILTQFNLEKEIEVERDTFQREISSVWSDNQNEVWVVTAFKYDNTQINIKLFKKQIGADFEPLILQKDNKPFVIKNKEDVDIYRDKNGFWILNNDLKFYLFNEKGYEISTTEKIRNLRVNSIFSRAQKIDNSLWMPSGSGIYVLTFKPNFFNLIPTGKNNFDCRGITGDDNGNVYLLNKSLYQYSPTINKIQSLKKINGTMHLMQKDSLLISGVYNDDYLFTEYNLKTDSFSYYKTSEPKLLLTSLILSPDMYLFGTSKGLVYLDIKNKKLLPFSKYNNYNYLADTEINHIHQNEKGIWLATAKGLFQMTEEAGIIKDYTLESGDLPFNYLRHLHEDEKGDFWLATVGGGLIHLTFSSEKDVTDFTQYTTEQGLSVDYLYAAYSDNYDNLWLPSDKGLMCFDKKTMKVRTFLESSGIPHNEFNRTSHYQSKDGTLYFGTLSGFFSFHPDQFVDDFKYSAPLQLTQVLLLEAGKDKTADKTESVIRESKITLKPSDKYLELRFALMDFEEDSKHNYIYKIEGYSKIWNTTDNNSIRITNLPYGEYTLKLKGESLVKGWSEEELHIKISVPYPFYLQWWFLVLAAMIVVCSTYFFIKRREQQLIDRKNQLEQIVKQRTQQIVEDKKIIARQSEKLKELDEAKTRFFSNIAHEFRTPLTLIIGPLEQYLSVNDSKSLNLALKSTRQLELLINQLLDISKLEDKKMIVEQQHGDIVNYTKQLVDQLEPLAIIKNLTLDFQTSLSVWEITFDQDKWNKILFNLIGNAIKFTPPKGRIQVKLEKIKDGEDEIIALTVKDTGLGIETSQLKNIFNRFYQADSSSTPTTQGTGLGLALVKELVEVQNGTIKVSSEVGKGTTFYIQIPLELLSDSDKKLNLLPTIPTIETESNSTVVNLPDLEQETEVFSVLIVDDNADIRSYVSSCIEHLNYRIIEAFDGQDGIDKALSHVPDLIISDVMMPRKNGFDLTTALREDIRTSHIPIVLLTAKSGSDSRLEGFARGADAYLAKPFSSQELVIRVQGLIELRKSIQQYFKNNSPIAIEETGTLSLEKEDIFLQQVKGIILENLQTSKLNGEFLAQKLFLSKGHLYRKIKALTDSTVHGYINRIKLEYALPLLKEGQLSVSEVSYQAGFSSPAYFSRVCKQEFGQSPSEFMK